MLTHEQLKNKALSKPGVKREYDALTDEFTLIATMIRARKNAGLTQADVAQKMGTTRSVISRLESGQWDRKHSPSIKTLERYVQAIGRTLVFEIR